MNNADTNASLEAFLDDVNALFNPDFPVKL
jgi:hypothetical protein